MDVYFEIQPAHYSGQDFGGFLTVTERYKITFNAILAIYLMKNLKYR
jgi:hypothetical protein